MPDSPLYLQDYAIFFTQMNNVYNEIKKKVLPSNIKFPLPHGSVQVIPLPLIHNSHLKQKLGGILILLCIE